VCTVLAPTALDVERRKALASAGEALFLAQWPAVPVGWNRRLRRAGRALIDVRGRRFRSARIELSPIYFEVYPGDLPGILVHEAVHVGLAVQGRDFGHGPEFRRACHAAGGLLHSRWLPGRVFRYRCPVCGDVLERRRRAADSRWCARCVAAAEAAGVDAWTPARALQLVATAFVGPEAATEARQPVCEPSRPGVRGGVPLGYPVGLGNDDDPRTRHGS
jgi:predicted SprT family Zn-dependent metalloprotease